MFSWTFCSTGARCDGFKGVSAVGVAGAEGPEGGLDGRPEGWPDKRGVSPSSVGSFRPPWRLPPWPLLFPLRSCGPVSAVSAPSSGSWFDES